MLAGNSKLSVFQSQILSLSFNLHAIYLKQKSCFITDSIISSLLMDFFWSWPISSFSLWFCRSLLRWPRSWTPAGSSCWRRRRRSLNSKLRGTTPGYLKLESYIKPYIVLDRSVPLQLLVLWSFLWGNKVLTHVLQTEAMNLHQFGFLPLVLLLTMKLGFVFCSGEANIFLYAFFLFIGSHFGYPTQISSSCSSLSLSRWVGLLSEAQNESKKKNKDMTILCQTKSPEIF